MATKTKNKSSPQKVKAKRATINSLQDVNTAFKQSQAVQLAGRKTLYERAVQLTQNIGASDLIRTEFLKFLLDGDRDIDAECGYPSWLTPDHYRAMYDREGIAKRVVHCEPEETWAMDPEVYEDEDSSNETEFEKAWADLLEEQDIWHHLCRIDILSGIGQYGILLIGLNDGKDLSEPVDGINEDGTWDDGNEFEITYLRPFTEEVTFVKIRDVDKKSPRYGLPKIYTVQFRDFPNWGVQAGEIIARDIHWSRVIHVADNLKESEVFGIPRMQTVYNRLYDCRKVYSSSGEGYWKCAFPGLAFEVNPELADQGIEIDEKSVKKQMDAYSNGLQRYIATTGLTTKTLPPALIEPTGTVETQLKAIAISMAIPYRVLFGSEEAKLASGQDAKAWNKRLARRQSKYVTPKIIRRFIDRLIAYGVLPQPKKKYKVDWPDLSAPSDIEKAQVALSQTQAIQAYTMGGASQLIPPMMFLMTILGFTQEQAQEAMDKQQEFDDQSDEDEEGDLQDDESDENEGDLGGVGSGSSVQADALNMENVGRSTTAGKAKQVESTLVQMPNLNQAMRKLGLNKQQRKAFKLIVNEWSDAAREASIEARQARAGYHNVGKDDSGKHFHADPDVNARLQSLKLPPAWKGVQVSHDPKAPLQATGVDEKGRTQYRYSQEHSDKAAAGKFARVKKFVQELPKIRERVQSDLASGKNVEEASVVRLIDRTGLRVGSTADTKADKQAYGASTLHSDHVVQKDDETHLHFTGKKGVDIKHHVQDTDVATDLKNRSAKGGKLFNTSDDKVRDYLHQISPGFKVKDFRTAVAADTAMTALKSMPKPNNMKELLATRKAVGAAVAAKLGNTPVVALKSYIPPEVFSGTHTHVANMEQAKLIAEHVKTTGMKPNEGAMDWIKNNAKAYREDFNNRLAGVKKTTAGGSAKRKAA